jgi:uncharacterized membrane protein
LVLIFLTLLKLILEIALLALVGQGLLYVLAGPRRESNFFYTLLRIITKPFTVPMRRVTPRKVADEHVPIATFFLLTVAWVVVTAEKVQYCIKVNMVGCQ